MRLLFVYYAFENQGSGLVIQGYSEAAQAMGHEVVVYGPENPKIPLDYSTDIEAADAVVFIFEWTTEIRHADQLDLARLVGGVPRRRRVILDGDGNYNDVIRVAGDFNHRNAEESRRWTEFCDSLTDKVCQPTLHPLRDDVLPFLFYAYNPDWAAPLNGRSKDFGMLYVGHCKFRWTGMRRVLEAAEPVRDRLGRMGVVGFGWDSEPWWAEPLDLREAYDSDPQYLRRVGVEVLPPIPFEEVVDWMGRARFNPVLTRPTFEYMRLVTPRYFETPAASTVPVFNLDEAHVREIYGDAGSTLVLGDDPTAKLLDILERPDHYRQVVGEVRAHLAEHHSHRARLRRLLEIIES